MVPPPLIGISPLMPWLIVMLGKCVSGPMG